MSIYKRSCILHIAMLVHLGIHGNIIIWRQTIVSTSREANLETFLMTAYF